MVISVLEESVEREGSPLSEEVEQEILEMVEDQLDRPNPPDTRVLYRRAMHFIDRDVRHLSLQQFNAKFPLQVKRRKAREREEARVKRGRDERSSHDGGATEPGSGDDGALRKELRSVLIDYARLVAGADTRPDVIDAVDRVDEYVGRVLEEM